MIQIIKSLLPKSVKERPRICSFCRNHNPNLSSFMTFHRVFNKSNRGCHVWSRNCLSFRNTWVFSWIRVAWSLVLCVMFCRSLFVLFLFAIVLSVLLWFRTSDYPFVLSDLLWFRTSDYPFVLSDLLWFRVSDYTFGIFWLPLWYFQTFLAIQIYLTLWSAVNFYNCV
jgi:hypothetical protein